MIENKKKRMLSEQMQEKQERLMSLANYEKELLENKKREAERRNNFRKMLLSNIKMEKR